MIFSKETIENLLGETVENFHYKTIYDLEQKIIGYDIFIQPQQEIKHIYVDFTISNDGETEIK